MTLLGLLPAGCNRQIAAELAESTVENNLSSLFHEIRDRDRAQRDLHAFAKGFVRRPMTGCQRVPARASNDPPGMEQRPWHVLTPTPDEATRAGRHVALALTWQATPR